MRAITAMLVATLRTLSRYPAQYAAGTLGPFMWAIPTLLMVRYADSLGLAQGFAQAVGPGPEAALTFVFCGAVFWNYIEGVWSLSLGLRNQMLMGTLEALWATPAPRLSLLLGMSAGRMLGVTLHSGVALAILVWFSPAVPLASWGLAAAVLICSVLAAYGFAFMLTGLSMYLKDDGSLVSIIGNAAPLLGGVVFPVFLLPWPLKVLSYAFPFTYGADALRGVLLGARTLLPLPWELALVGGMGILLPLLGWRVFTRLEQSARRDGLQGF